MAKKVLGWIAFSLMLLTIGIFIVAAFTQNVSQGTTMLKMLALFSIFFVGGVVGIVVGEKVKILTGILLILAGIDTLFFGFLCMVSNILIGMPGLFFGFMSCVLYIISAVLFLVTKKEK